MQAGCCRGEVIQVNSYSVQIDVEGAAACNKLQVSLIPAGRVLLAGLTDGERELYEDGGGGRGGGGRHKRKQTKAHAMSIERLYPCN
jgi:hypothetical protein